MLYTFVIMSRVMAAQSVVLEIDGEPTCLSKVD